MFKSIKSIKEVLFGEEVALNVCTKCKCKKEKIGRNYLTYLFTCNNEECEEKGHVYEVTGDFKIKSNFILIEKSIHEEMSKLILKCAETNKIRVHQVG